MAVVEAQSQFHVLAVDDSLMDRKLIERLLKTSSFQVTTVDSGSKALEFLVSPSQQEIEVNLIITDYCMPGMTGYDLLKKIKESSYLKNIPDVIMSSENVPSRINRCLEEGAEEFILKPVQLSDMNRLKPHLLKGKSKEEKKEQQKQEEILINETRGDSTHGFSIKQQQQQLLLQMKEGNENVESTKKSTKRKAMDEGSFPEKSRPRLE